MGRVRTSMGRAGVLMVLATVLVAACGGGSGGTVHPLGEEVTFTHAQVEGTGYGDPTALTATALAVRQGTIAELEAGGFEVEDDQRSLTPWYVDQRYRNAGTVTINRGLRVSLENEAGDLITAVTIFNYGGTEFEACPDGSDGDADLGPGESFDTCTLFFAEPGEAPAKVSFLPTEPGTETDWIYWAAK